MEEDVQVDFRPTHTHTPVHMHVSMRASMLRMDHNPK